MPTSPFCKEMPASGMIVSFGFIYLIKIVVL